MHLLGTSWDVCSSMGTGGGGLDVDGAAGVITVVGRDEPILSPYEATTLAVGVVWVLALLAS